ncbi:hypothetical protein ABZP36_029690 [Zizania latifolia]
MAASSDRGSTSSSSCKGKTSTGDEHLDALIELFPQVNLLTLIDVCLEFKNDVDAAVEYIFCNVLPTIPDDHNANADRDLHIEGPASVDNNVHPDSVQFDVPNKYTAENKDSVMGENVMQSPHAASSGQDILLEDNNSDCLVASAQNSLVRCSNQVLGGYDDEQLQYSSSEEKHDVSAFDDDQPLHDNGLTDDDQNSLVRCSNHLIGGYDDEQLQSSSSEEKHDVSASAFDDDQPSHDGGLTDMIMQGIYSPLMEELTIVVANENYETASLMIEMSNISQKLQEVELKEAKAKQVVSEASQAGNDILVKAEELREMTMLAVEENNKVVAGEVLAAQSILASEAHGLRAQFLNLYEERKQFLAIIDRMSNTLERRLAVVELESTKAEKEKIERETLAKQALKKQELLFDAVKERSKKLEQDARDIAKRRVDMQPLEPMQVPSSMFSSVKSTNNSAQLLRSGVDEPQLSDDASPGWSSPANSIHNIAQAELIVDEPQRPVYEPLQQASLGLSNSVMKSANNIAQLLGREHDTYFPVDEPQFSIDASPIMSSLANPIPNITQVVLIVDEPQLPVYEPLQLSVNSADNTAQLLGREHDTRFFDESELSVDALPRLSSPANSIHNIFIGDEETDDASSDNTFALDDSWDVVDDEAI